MRRASPDITGSSARNWMIARAAGARMILVAPMVSGVGSLAALTREGGVPVLAHPALAGAARIAPPLLLGKLFRLFGADATIFPNAGGRFSYWRGDLPRDCRCGARAVGRSRADAAGAGRRHDDRAGAGNARALR